MAKIIGYAGVNIRFIGLPRGTSKKNKQVTVTELSKKSYTVRHSRESGTLDKSKYKNGENIWGKHLFICLRVGVMELYM